LNGIADPASPVAGAQTPMTFTWTIANNGIVPTSDHVWIELLGTSKFNQDSAECNPTAICSQLGNPIADLGVMAPGDLATITLNGTYDASGSTAGDMDGMVLIACIMSGPSTPNARPNRNVRPNETIDLGNGCFGTEVQITIAAPEASASPDPSASASASPDQSASASPDPSASATLQATLPPTSSSSNDRPAGSSFPMVLLSLLAAAGVLLATRSAVKRSHR
jgi:hypothetical protein